VPAVEQSLQDMLIFSSTAPSLRMFVRLTR
jgi:hypothetical protein